MESVNEIIRYDICGLNTDPWHDCYLIQITNHRVRKTTHPTCHRQVQLRWICYLSQITVMVRIRRVYLLTIYITETKKCSNVITTLLHQTLYRQKNQIDKSQIIITTNRTVNRNQPSTKPPTQSNNPVRDIPKHQNISLKRNQTIGTRNIIINTKKNNLIKSNIVIPF